MPQQSSPVNPDEPYESFYGLREQPFTLSTDPRFLFLSASHRRAHDEMLTGLRRREGLMVLTGEAGTGKTTLCRAVLDALGQRTFSALILNPYMSDADVIRVILRDFGLVSRDEIRRGALANADMPQLLDTLEQFLLSLLPLNTYAVVVVDEAQSLAPQVLDQIRVLGGYEHDGQRLLQIVLVGQPGLTQTIRAEPLRALNERITRRLGLVPLTRAEVDEYIRHRLLIAGGGERVTFVPGAVTIIADLARGLPRRVNLLCDRALEEGRLANSMKITAEMVKRAARAVAGDSALAAAPPPFDLDLDLGLVKPQERELTLMATPPPARRTHAGLIVFAIFAILAAAAAAGFYAWTLMQNDPILPTAPTAPARDVGQLPPKVSLPTEAEVRRRLDASKDKDAPKEN